MNSDDVLIELSAAKEAFAASRGYDLRAMITTLRSMDAESGVPTVSFAPRKPEGVA